MLLFLINNYCWYTCTAVRAFRCGGVSLFVKTFRFVYVTRWAAGGDCFVVVTFGHCLLCAGMALRPWCLRHSAVESLLSKFTLAKIKVKTSADPQQPPGVDERSLGDAQSSQCAPWAFPGRPQGALWAPPGCLLAACWAPSGCLQCAFRLTMGFPLAHWSRLAASWASPVCLRPLPPTEV